MKDEIIIRAMNELDVNHVLELWSIALELSFLKNSVKKEDLIKYIKRNPGVSSVACTVDRKVIGALLCGHDGIRGFIYHIAVSNEYRVSEIAKRMLNHSLLKLGEVGIKTGFIFTQNNNYGMDETFNSIGWVVVPNKLSSGEQFGL
ncbi:GCN5-related N-acetyltransferase [Clostridium sp. DL-VIII]|uniref:GNAT family N-acetyltransferase n=1 Tax=Clostridium sp. DL-VIII TaxID=641107 RepID=UPI00023AF237|nr:GNAT family N-acetyltransferase [Clostridium sp. DL-VIII]EHI97667.1 GCN5-related N-acetyltransferase [Clostridium sp. DL-VIII]